MSVIHCSHYCVNETGRLLRPVLCCASAHVCGRTERWPGAQEDDLEEKEEEYFRSPKPVCTQLMSPQPRQTQPPSLGVYISERKSWRIPEVSKHLKPHIRELSITKVTIRWCNSPLRVRACQPTAGLTSTCPQTEDYYPTSLAWRVVSMSLHSTVVRFLDRNNCHKSVATQITHDARVDTEQSCRVSNPWPLRSRYWFCLCATAADAFDS